VIPGIPDVQQILQRLSSLLSEYGHDQEVRSTALSIANPDRDDANVSNASRIAHWVRDRYVYVRDPLGVEFISTPTEMLQEISSSGKTHEDCESVALLFLALCRSVGIDGAFAATKINGSQVYNHVVAVLQLPGGPKIYDLTLPKGKTATYKDFLLMGAKGGVSELGGVFSSIGNLFSSVGRGISSTFSSVFAGGASAAGTGALSSGLSGALSTALNTAITAGVGYGLNQLLPNSNQSYGGNQAYSGGQQSTQQQQAQLNAHQQAAYQQQIASGNTNGGGIDTNTVLIIGGMALVAVVLTSKK
jgi:hypothetical protein